MSTVLQFAHRLDRTSPLPLYAQVKRRLQQLILSWPAADDRFHSDHELVAQFGVSRATIRQALAALEAEGLLRRVQGFGTFVNRHKIEESFTPKMDFLDQWARSGRSLRVEVLAIDEAPCPQPFAGQLGIEPGAACTLIERFRLSGGLRIAFDRRFIPPAIARRVGRRALKMVSLLDALATVVALDRGENRIEAALAGEDIAERLELLPQDPVLIRHLVYYSKAEEPVMAGVSTYRADQVRYSLTVPMSVEPAPLNTEFRAVTGAHKARSSTTPRERKSR